MVRVGRWTRGLSLLILCSIAAFPAQVPSSQPLNPDETRNAAEFPFSEGERLVYSVFWHPPWYLFFLPAMEAGEIELRMVGPVDYNDGKAIKILFNARSSGILASLSGMKIDDEFIFLSEPETFCALKVSKKIREGKRKRQIQVEYLREKHQLHIREFDEAAVPPTLKKDELKDNIPACIQDPFSALYSLRRAPLQAEYVQKSWIGHDDKFKEVRSEVEKKENVETPVGKFPAWRINTVSLMGGLFRDGGEFRIWLSADEKKAPLQFEAKVQLGRVLGKLKRMQ
jgi:hypothetical protein